MCFEKIDLVLYLLKKCWLCYFNLALKQTLVMFDESFSLLAVCVKNWDVDRIVIRLPKTTDLIYFRIGFNEYLRMPQVILFSRFNYAP